MEEESLNWEQEREQRKKLFPNEPETKVAKDYYTSLMLREFYTTSPEVADIVDETVKNALKTMKYSRSRKNVFGERGDAVSLTDLPYCPYPVEDPDLRLLYGFFGRKNEFFEFAEDYTEDDSIGQLTDLSPIWLERLNYLLNTASINAKYYGMSLSFFKQEMSKWCEVIEETKEDGSKKSKIYFHIKSAEDYRAFLKDLTTHNSKDKSYKRLKSDWRKGFFLLKFLNAGDIENSEVFQNRGILFPRIIQQVWCKFLWVKDIPVIQTFNEQTKEIEYSVDFNGWASIGERKIKVHLLARIKSKKSIDEKLSANIAYKNFQATNDLFGFQINGQNYEETLFLVNTFTRFCLDDPHHVFRSIDKESITWENKSFLHDNNAIHQKLVDNIEDEEVKEIIKNAVEKKKPATSPNYSDIKTSPLMGLNGKLFCIEDKFTEPDWETTNERGPANHDEYKLGSVILPIESRIRKFVSPKRVDKEIEKTLKNNPVLIDQQGKGDPDKAKEEIQNYINDLLETLIVGKGENKLTYQLDKWIYRNYAHKGLLPDHYLG